MNYFSKEKGFTLIETFVAITILTIAIVAPMSLVARSLSISYYVRDEITASYLAQEGIEVVRNVRDSNLIDYLKNGDGVDQMAGIPIGTEFLVDSGLSSLDPFQNCSGLCPPISYNGEFYGYNDGIGNWVPTKFTRTVVAEYADDANDDLEVRVTVTWQTGGFQVRTVTLVEHIYRWIQ